MSYVCDNNGESTDVKRKVVVGGGGVNGLLFHEKLTFNNAQ